MHAYSAVALLAGLCCSVACGGPAPSPSPISSGGTIGFNGLAGSVALITSHSESGFTVSAVSGDWSARSDYGHPAPFIQFWAERGNLTSGEIQITASGSSFYFESVDLYSSTTPIPYTITGSRNGSTVFRSSDTLPNTFGDFRTVFNPHTADAIDTLSIVLTNAAAACCRNPMGLDSIALASTPSPTPATFSLTGQVTDAASGVSIPNALLSIADGPNAGATARTDGSGNYRFTGLIQSAFTVTASAANYISQSKGVTLTSNQTVSFQLTPQRTISPPPPPPAGATVIGFGALSGNGSPVNSYTESGFTVSTASGPWVASITYGNPPPFIQFSAPGGTTVTGEVRVTAGGSAFSFYSVDFYSSTTPIPFTITGFRNSSPVFTLADTLPNTLGAFKTVTNGTTPPIDALSIVLTNAAAACCQNPMGLDNIVIMR